MGVGLSAPQALQQPILAHSDEIDFLEVIADHYLEAPQARLRDLAALRETFPILPHGVGLSLGTATPVNPAYLDRLATLVEHLEPPWCSEHLSFTQAGNHEIGHLAALPFTREAAEVTARNIVLAQSALPVPLLIENIAYLTPLPGQEMSEAEFLTTVLESADCGLLLDLTNVFTNATNHAYDAVDFLDSVPLERVVEIHLAGGYWEEGILIDSHSAPVMEEVWKLLQYVVQESDVRAILLERDEDFPPIGELIDELRTARQIWGTRGVVA